MAIDYAGNTLDTAKEFNASTNIKTFKDNLDLSDINDYYRFNIGVSSNFNLSLNGLSGDANVELIGSEGKVLQKSTNSGNQAEFINFLLDTGTYYIRVYANTNANTAYNLNVSSNPSIVGTSSTGGSLTTGGSEAPIYRNGEVVPTPTGEGISLQGLATDSLIGINNFRADPRFNGIDGRNFSAVILDTGIDLNHPFFGADNNNNGIADRIVYQYDFADGDSNASDVNGHGSNVSSIIASQNSNYKGMAPGANIIHLKVFKNTGEGSFAYVEQALQWVVANASRFNIASVNMSLGDNGNYSSRISNYGIGDELSALASSGVIVASASGNSFYQLNSVQGVAYPSADPNSLSVGAVYDSNSGGWSYGGARAYSSGTDYITPFSQRHSTMTSVFAPGAPIVGAGPTGNTVSLHGTSQASPHIAGVAVLAQQLAVQELGRRLTFAEFKNLVSSTGVTINDGDNENDNVNNTGLNFKRVDMLRLGEGILNLKPKPTVTISAGDATAAETNSGQTANPGQFTISRTGSTTTALTVSYTIGGTATNGSDYQAITNTAIIPIGATSVNLPVNITNDSLVESNETVSLTLANNSNYTVGTSNAALVNIADNDVLPTVTISAGDATAAETNSGQTANPGQFTISRTGSTTTALTVSYTIGGTATNGSDYQAITNTVVIPIGASSVNLPVNITNDSLVEGNETVNLTLANNSNYTVGTSNAAVVNIADNDVLPTVTISAGDATAAETNTGETANPGQFTISRTGSTATSLTINYTIGGSATNGSDYSTINNSITIAAGATSAVLPINIINDSLVENNETIVLTLAANNGYAIGTANNATVNIADNDTVAITDPFVAVAPRSSDTTINSLWNTSNGYWNTSSSGGKITYSFLKNSAASSYYGTETVSEVNDGIKNNVRSILSSLESLINVSFVEVADTATNYGVLRYMFSNGPEYAYAYNPQSNTDKRSGDVHFNQSFESQSDNRFAGGIGTHGYTAVIHETLHALGLKHPGNYNGSGTGEGPFLSPDRDNTTNSLMSYNFDGPKAITPMAYDIKALQYVYGAKSNNATNTNYSFNTVHGYTVGGQFKGSTSQIKQSIWDSSGIDTLDFSGLAPSTSYRFDLNPGGILTTQTAYNGLSYTDRSTGGRYTTSNYGTTLAYNASIENLINSRGNDYIIANSASNRFQGYNSGIFTGNDTLVSTSSSDVLELSGYTLASLRPTVSGGNLNLSLGSNGSISITNYYGSSGSMKIFVSGNYYTYNSSAGWQISSAPLSPDVDVDKAFSGVTSKSASQYNSTSPLVPIECNCAICSPNEKLINSVGNSNLSQVLGIS